MTKVINLSKSAPLVLSSPDVAIQFDVAEGQTGSFWNSSQPTRITVPAGVTQLELFGYMNVPAGGVGGTDIQFDIKKNNVLTVRIVIDDPSYGAVVVHSGLLDVVPGDYFEIHAFTYFADVTVPAGSFVFGAATPERKGFVSAFLASNTTPAVSADTQLPWATPEIDTHSAYSGPGTFVVPAGVTHAVVSINGMTNNYDTSPDNWWMVKKNGAVVRQWRDTLNFWMPGPPCLGIIPVSPGEAITIDARSSLPAGVSLLASGTKIMIEWISAS